MTNIQPVQEVPIQCHSHKEKIGSWPAYYFIRFSSFADFWNKTDEHLHSKSCSRMGMRGRSFANDCGIFNGVISARCLGMCNDEMTIDRSIRSIRSIGRYQRRLLSLALGGLEISSCKLACQQLSLPWCYILIVVSIHSCLY
jgi:hypothetical protein